MCYEKFLGETVKLLQISNRVVHKDFDKEDPTNKSPQPGLYIFTAKHFSFVRVTATKARPDLGPEDYEKATAAQLLALWGPSAFAAFFGTYELAGGKLTTRP